MQETHKLVLLLLEVPKADSPLKIGKYLWWNSNDFKVGKSHD